MCSLERMKEAATLQKPRGSEALMGEVDRLQVHDESGTTLIPPHICWNCQNKQAFFHLRLWAFELKLRMDGHPWNQVRTPARRSEDFPE